MASSCTVTVVGSYDEDDWGISTDEAGFTAMTSVSLTERVEKAEGKNSKGCVVAVAYYNKTSEVSIEGLGKNIKEAGESLTLTSVSPENGTVYVDESSVEYSYEDWVKTTIKGTAYENIT